jgi:hypothetical protein
MFSSKAHKDQRAPAAFRRIAPRIVQHSNAFRFRAAA